MVRQFVYIVFIVTLIISCSDTKNEVLDYKIKNIRSKSGYGSVKFYWDNPTSEYYYYSEFSFIDSNGDIRNSKVSKFSDSLEITGFSDDSEYEFNIYSYNEDGVRSEPELLKISPMKPAFRIVEATLSGESVVGGIRVRWQNRTGKEVIVSVKYITADGELKTKSLSTSANDTVIYVAGLKPEEQVFKVYVSDMHGNTTDIRNMRLKPILEKQVNKTKCEVIGFSSEEPYESSASIYDNQGLAVAIIDDDLDTFWHSAWKDVSPAFPHFVTIDCKDTIIMSRVELFRRKNNAHGAIRHKVMVSLDAENWLFAGEGDFDTSTDEAQEIVFPEMPMARYLKIVATEGPEHYTHLAEINIYGGGE